MGTNAFLFCSASDHSRRIIEKGPPQLVLGQIKIICLSHPTHHEGESLESSPATPNLIALARVPHPSHRGLP